VDLFPLTDNGNFSIVSSLKSAFLSLEVDINVEAASIVDYHKLEKTPIELGFSPTPKMKP